MTLHPILHTADLKDAIDKFLKPWETKTEVIEKSIIFKPTMRKCERTQMAERPSSNRKIISSIPG